MPETCFLLVSVCHPLTVWFQACCRSNDRALMRDVSTGVWRRGEETIRGIFGTFGFEWWS